MKNSSNFEVAKGITLGLIAFMFLITAFPLQPAHAAVGNGRPYFQITLEAPSTNPSRRQWAAITQNSFSNAGIAANLIYVATFTILAQIVLGPTAYKLYSAGGFDAFFVGAGGGTAIPDFGTQNVVYYKYATTSDVPPAGSNWYWWKNDTYNALANQYGSDFNAAERVTIARKMVQIVAQERPGLTILYPAAVYAYAPALNGWNTGGPSKALTATTAERDFMHWAGATTINMAETGDIDNINVIDTASQNTLYSQNVVVNLEEPTQEPDGRAVATYACDGISPCTGIAKWIMSSSDKLTWTENTRAHNFQDGVPVTADDYVFTTQAQNNAAVGWVGLGTIETQLGLYTQYTYLNGTTSYINNGTYAGHTAPAGWKVSSAWKALNATAFQWTMPALYVFTNPIVSSIIPLPKHLYEKYPSAAWSTGVLSGFTGTAGELSTKTYTYTWDKTKYGGNGSYTAYGPVTDGAYVYHGYDPVSQTATIVKNPDYWNTTGLAAVKEFTATTIHFVHVTEKAAAIAGLGNKVYNVLDSQYTFNKDDEKSISAAGGLPILVSDPSNGWQDLVLNDNSPIWGTGTATPLGQSNPAMAHKAALLVRKALSYLIPRQDIVNQLLQGIGAPAISSFYDSYNGSGIYHDMYAGINPDPYDPFQAQVFLAQAGYNTGALVGGTVTLPQPNPITANCTTTTVPTISVPNFVQGNTLTLTGAFLVNPGELAGKGGAAITLQESNDNGTTWVPVTFTSTNEGAYYTISYQPLATATLSAINPSYQPLWYRVFFTGIPWTSVQSLSISSPGRVESRVPPQTKSNGLSNLNITSTQYGTITKLKVGTLNGILNSLAASETTAITNGLCNLQKNLSDSTTKSLQTLNSNIQTALQTLQSQAATKGDVQTITASVNSVQSQVSGLTNISYAALAVAVILGLGAIGLTRRKP